MIEGECIERPKARGCSRTYGQGAFEKLIDEADVALEELMRLW
jgi:hypothetical protein